MKTESLTLRITPKLRTEIEKIAQDNDMKLSALVHEILDNYIEEKKITESINIFDDSYSNLKDYDFFNSNQFIYLFSWITDMQNNQFENKSKVDATTLSTIKTILLSSLANKHIPRDVKQEFEKILQDVLQYQNQTEYYKSLQFNKRGNTASINFQIINDFLFNLMKSRSSNDND